MSDHDPASEHDAADVTVPLAAPSQWKPGPKLAARVAPAQPRRQIEQRRDPRIMSAVILLAAIAIAVALWITALWLKAADEPAPDPTSDTESTISTLYWMEIGDSYA